MTTHRPSDATPRQEAPDSLTRGRSGLSPRSVVTGLIMTGLFAVLGSYFSNRHGVRVASTQIPVLPYGLLLVWVVGINPLCRLLRRPRPFSVPEILVVFVMGAVSAGISTYGFVDHLLPAAGSLFNRHWNTAQSEWSRYVAPYVNEAYFVSVPGIREAARAYAAAVEAAETANRRVLAALQYAEACRRRDAESAARKADGDKEWPGDPVGRSTATEEMMRAAEQWRAVTGEQPPTDPEREVRKWRDEWTERRRLAELQHRKLTEREEQAFRKVELFRRGLPAGMRPSPGFLPGADDHGSSGLARLRRLRCAREALRTLHTVESVSAGDELTRDDDAARAWAQAVRAAAEALRRAGNPVAWQEEATRLDRTVETLTARILNLEEDHARVSGQKRAATAQEAAGFERRIRDFERRLTSARKEQERLLRRRRQVAAEWEAHGRLWALAEQMEARAKQVESAGAVDGGESRATLTAWERELAEGEGSWRRYLAGDVPWGDWAGVLGRWLLLAALTYTVLMTLNVLIFRQWAHHEKLIYPLVQLPEILAGHGEESGRIPRLFCSGLFWAGFSVSAIVIGWNLLACTNILPGVQRIDLLNFWRPYIKGTSLQGLIPSAMSAIFFTVIGLSFLIPKKVSFSLWLFYVLYMAQLLVLVHAGYGVNESSFPREWWYTLNFQTAEGGGALIVFASVVLFKCRRYLLCGLRPRVVADLESDERRELRVCSLLFLASSAGVIAMLWRGLGANLLYTLLAYFMILAITVGFVRAVTEGGILGFQSWVSPFHFLRSFLGMHRAWTSPALWLPLLIYYAVFFLDLKTFLAPAMANALKIRDDLRLSRGRFHAAVALAIGLAALVTVAVGLMMAYARGADAMDPWFYTGFPRALFERAASTVKTPPRGPLPWDIGWTLAGAGGMAALLYFRRTFFWLPHPIGMIMLVNPLMAFYWFSIFLGWAAKAAVTRYGRRETYLRVRPFFIGLIAGELILVATAMAVSHALNIRIPIDLNRDVTW